MRNWEGTFTDRMMRSFTDRMRRTETFVWIRDDLVVSMIITSSVVREDGEGELPSVGGSVR